MELLEALFYFGLLQSKILASTTHIIRVLILINSRYRLDTFKEVIMLEYKWQPKYLAMHIFRLLLLSSRYVVA